MLKQTRQFSKPQLITFIVAFSLIGYLIFRSFALNPNLPGDLNNDNTVNITDMSILLSNYGTTNTTADINSDGTVNVLDLSILLSHYGQVYTPQQLVQTSSLAQNATISSIYAWTITTNIPEGQVEYFVQNVSLGKATGTTSFTYNLDTTKYTDGLHNGGYWIYDSGGNVVYKSPSISFNTQNGVATPPSGNLLTFGNFTGGNFSEFSDTSCGGNKTTLHVGGGPGGGNWAHVQTDDTQMCYNDTTNVRVHLLQFAGTPPVWFNNKKEIWGAISMRIPSGFTTNDIYAGLEIHGDNGTGVAPFHIAYRNNQWNMTVGGADAEQNSRHAFASWDFGGIDSSDQLYGGKDYRRHTDWVGGNHTIVANEWVNFRFGMYFDYDNNNGVGNGWFEAWARWGNMSSWDNIVPRVNGIPIGTVDVDGNGRTIYPMLSMYYTRGQNLTHALDYAAGAYSDDKASLAAWQDARLGF